MDFKTIINETEHEVTIEPNESIAKTNGNDHPYDLEILDNGRMLLRLGKKIYTLDEVKLENKQVSFLLNGDWFNLTVLDEQDLLMEKMGFKSADEIGQGQLNAPMPGKILDLMHKVGDEVELGEPVAILEAMKMENELKAPVGGIIKSIEVEVGQNVEKNEPILEIENSG